MALYTTVPLDTDQRDTAACSWISVLVLEQLVLSPTPSMMLISRAIDQGMQAYREFRALSPAEQFPYCGQQSGMENDPTRPGQLRPLPPERIADQASAYYTVDVAVAHLRPRLHIKMTVSEMIFGYNLPQMFPVERLPQCFVSPEFGFKLSLRSGLQQFLTAAAATPEGQACCAVLTVRNHTVALAAVMLPDSSARYYCVETLADPSRGQRAELVHTNLQVGIEQYLEQHFPLPANLRTEKAILDRFKLLEQIQAPADSDLMFTLTPVHVHLPASLAISALADGALAQIVPTLDSY